MITEYATLKAAPEQVQAFEQAASEARVLFLSHLDCRSFRLDRVVETPGVYLLIVGWASVAAHVDDFRQTEAFQRWRELAGPFFVDPPQVIHGERAV
jgi:quinol monooxygenase YgiN